MLFLLLICPWHCGVVLLETTFSLFRDLSSSQKYLQQTKRFEGVKALLAQTLSRGEAKLSQGKSLREDEPALPRRVSQGLPGPVLAGWEHQFTAAWPSLFGGS